MTIGAEVETAELLANDWGRALKIVQTTGATCIPNLQTNKTDMVISTLAATGGRKQVIDSRRHTQADRDGRRAGISASQGLVRSQRRGGGSMPRSDIDMTKRSAEVGFMIARYDDEGPC